MKVIRNIISTFKNNIYLNVLIFCIPFIISHLSFFLYYPLPKFGKDLYQYWLPAIDILNNHLPIFINRPPGYPMFLYITNIFNSHIIVLLIQSILTLLVSIFILIKIRKKIPFIYFPVYFSLLIFISSPIILDTDTMLMSEALYIDLLLLSFFYLIISLYTNNKKDWLICSFLIGITFLIKPQGLYVIVLIILSIGYLFYIKKKVYFKQMLIPFVSIFLGLAIYNYFTVNIFSTTIRSTFQNLSPSVSYIEPDAKYPEEINKVIIDFDKEINKNKNSLNSWDVNELRKPFLKWRFANKLIREINYVYYKDIIPANILNPKYTLTTKICDKIALDAKMKHPLLYFKFYYFSFYQYNNNFAQPFWFYYKELYQRSKDIKTPKNVFNIFMGNEDKEIQKVVLKNYFNVLKNKEKDNIADNIYFGNTYRNQNNYILIKIANFIEHYYNMFFRNVIWIILFYSIFIFSIFKVIKNKFKDFNYVLLLFIGVFFILAISIVSLFQYPFLRLSLSTEFIYYLYPFLFIKIILLKFNNPDKIVK